MMAGGMPGPGTVSWPAKKRLRRRGERAGGLKTAVWKSVLARP